LSIDVFPCRNLKNQKCRWWWRVGDVHTHYVLLGRALRNNRSIFLHDGSAQVQHSLLFPYHYKLQQSPTGSNSGVGFHIFDVLSGYFYTCPRLSLFHISELGQSLHQDLIVSLQLIIFVFTVTVLIQFCLFQNRCRAVSSTQLYRQLQVVHIYVMAVVEGTVVAAFTVGIGVVIMLGFLLTRVQAGLPPALFFLNMITVALIDLDFFFKMTLAVKLQSSSFITMARIEARSKYMKAVGQSLRPLRMKLGIYIDNPNIFLTLVNKVIINYIVTLIVTF